MNQKKDESSIHQLNLSEFNNLSSSSDKNNSQININSYLKKGQKAYKVLKYHENCEEDNQISYILPLVRTTPKFILFIILNICSVGIINIFLEWFPKFILYIYYSVTDLKSATNFGIFSKLDEEFEVVEKNEIDLSKIDNDSKKRMNKNFNFNIELDTNQIITFEYRYFKYLYSISLDNFEALSYSIKATQKNILNYYSTGLNSNEVLYMRNIFGKCDIDIKINSWGHILFDELTDPYYIFLLYSLILWFCLGSYIYAIFIMVLDIICFFLSVCESYSNLKKIQILSRYSCPVKVYRKNEKNNLIGMVQIDSTELVPGDVFEIPEEGLEMPCDAILISGDVIVKESKLTGDSTPVMKERMNSNEDIFDTNKLEYEKHTLFTGTKIILKRKVGIDEPKAIVFRTGFETFEGNVIADILNADEDDQNFTRDSIKYIIIMGILTIIFFSISLKFLIVEGKYSAYDTFIYFLDLITDTIDPSLPTCLSIGVTYSLSRLKRKGFFTAKRYKINKAGSVNMLIFDKTGTLTEDHLDIKGFVTTEMNDNKQFKFNNIKDNCQEESDIIIKHFKNKNKCKNWNKDLLQYYIECLACCHCLTYFNGNLIGDPVDVKMFESVGWIIKENIKSENDKNFNPLILDYIKPKSEEELDGSFQGKNKEGENIKTKYEIGIVKRFNLDSNLRRMTIIGKNPNENFFKVYCKGSPEMIRLLSIQSTIPNNFNEILNNYTSKGYRVLALAAKSININFQQIKTLHRDVIENNFIFLGFLIIENKLKENTKNTLKKFDEADLGMIMVTGDNLRTAICVSRECNLINQDQEIFSCEIEKLNGIERLKWNKLKNNNDIIEIKPNNSNEQKILNNNNKKIQNDSKLNPENNYLLNSTSKTLFEIFPPENIIFKQVNYKNISTIVSNKFLETHNLIKGFSKLLRRTKLKEKIDTLSDLVIKEENDPSSFVKDKTFGIAIKGSTFELLYQLDQRYNKFKNPFLSNIHNLYRLILRNGKVFARMTPENKALLVKELKREGFTTLMCGDGANDYPALRAADVSISLSPEKTSFAGDFNYSKLDIYCIYDLLREGKCSLTTSIQTFKYMMLYSMIQSICVVLVAIYSSEVTDNQFLISDIFLIFPLELFLSMTKPYSQLTFHYPNTNLLSFPIIISIIIHSLIVFSFQFGGYKILKDHYDWDNICIFDEDDTALPCHENTIIFLISIFQYTGSAISFFVSKPFRQRIYTNWILMIYLAGIYFYSIWITINCDSWSKKVLNLFDLEKKVSDEEESEDKSNIIKGGKKMKYFIFIIAIVNTIVSIAFEWIIMKFVNRYYERNQINKFKENIEEEKLSRQNSGQSKKNKEVEIYKYHRVYYYNRREKENKKHS